VNAAHTAGLLGAFKDHPDEDCSSSVAYIRAVGADRGNEICIAYSTDPATDYGAQRDADVHRLVACWNACDGVPTEDLQQLGAGGVLALTGLTEQYRQERDLLLAELKFVHRYWDQLNGHDAGRIKKLMDRMLDLQQPPAVPSEAAAIGAALGGESLEQGEPA